MPKHASASLAVLDLVMASPAQPAARRSPRRLCLLSARSDDQPLPRSDQKGKLYSAYNTLLLIDITLIYSYIYIIRLSLFGPTGSMAGRQSAR